eukprot:TRINITY_DN2260_c0_g1_i1.p1 TRINITY_DN2260_c0_g1~~TRINITY_DN2260_c0_g1_i1.p1  ORF type:complete len:507 (-),score=134.86 TRINITY_DN2260_c0_g1_i1:278-1798(-)
MNAEQFKEQGNQAFKAQNYSEAVEFYAKAIALEPKPHYYTNRAIALNKTCRTAEALNDCDFAVEIDPTFEKAFVVKGNCYLTMGEFELAKETYQLAKTMNVDEKLANVNHVQSSFDRLFSFNPEDFNKDEIEVAYEVVRHNCLNVPKAAIASVKYLLATSRASMAKRLAEKILQHHSTYEPAMCAIASSSCATGDFDRAIAITIECIKRNPDATDLKQKLKAYKTLKEIKDEANALYKAGDVECALEKYLSGVTFCEESRIPVAPVFHSNAAACLQKQEDLDGALTQCDLALSLDNEYSKAYNRRAQCLLAKDEFEKARETYTTALSLLPEEMTLRRSMLAAIEEEDSDVNMVVELAKSNDFWQILRAEKRVVVVDFYASWCQPCKQVAPIYAMTAQMFPDAVFLKLDGDKMRDVSGWAGIGAFPTFKLYHNCQCINTIQGGDMNALQTKLTALLTTLAQHQRQVFMCQPLRLPVDPVEKSGCGGCSSRPGGCCGGRKAGGGCCRG